MKVLCAVLLTAAVLAEVAPGGPDPGAAPESQKMEITLPHIGKVIQIVAEHPVEKVYSESTAVSILSPTGEVLKVKPKNYRHSTVTPEIPLRKKKRDIQYGNPIVQTFYAQRNARRDGDRRLQIQIPTLASGPTSDGINPVSPTGQSQSYSSAYFMSESQQYLLSHNIDMDVHVQKLKVAFSNLQNLEAQFYSLMAEFAQPTSNYTVDPNTRNLLQNYVAHLDYIKSAQGGQTPATPPPLYDYYTHNQIGIMDMMTLTEWEYFKQQNSLNGLIAAKTNPLAITPQASYGSTLYDPQVQSYFKRRLHHHHHRRSRFRNRRAQDTSMFANQLRVSNSTSPYQGYTRINLPEKLAKEQLAVFILVTEGTQSHYEALYRMLPQTSEVPSNVDSLLFQDALVIFHKVCQFATITYMTLESIWNDLNEIDIFFKAIPNNMLNTLSFYRLDDDFLSIKCMYGNNTQGVARLNADFGNLTASIQKTMDQVLVEVYNCKLDISTILAKTQPYRDYKGDMDLYSQDMQRIMKAAIADVGTFWDLKTQIDQHLEDLRAAEIDLRGQDQAIWDLLEKHKRMAGLGRLLGQVGALVLVLLAWK